MPKHTTATPAPLSDDWFDLRFSKNTPANLRAMSEAFCRAYATTGLSDPMYIANVTAFELGWGSGSSVFTPIAEQEKATDSALYTVADRLSFSYRTCVHGDSVEDILAIITKALAPATDKSFPASEYIDGIDSPEDLTASAAFLDSLKGETDAYTVASKILAGIHCVILSDAAINGIISEFAVTRLTMPEVIDQRMIAGSLDKAIIARLPGYAEPLLINEDERRERFVARITERYAAGENEVYRLYKDTYGDLFLQGATEKDTNYVRRCANQNFNDAEYGGALFQRTYESIKGIHQAPAAAPTITETLDDYRAKYVSTLVAKHLAGDETIYKAFNGVYSDSHDQSDGETDVAYIQRCAEQDFYDGHDDAAAFQDIYDQITGRDDSKHSPS